MTKASGARFSLPGSRAHERSKLAGDFDDFRRDETARRLPFSYRDIANLATALDIAIALISALVGQALTQLVNPHFQSDAGRELSAAVFVSILFVTTLRMRELYEPLRLMNWRDQASAIVAAWCGAFLVFASGLFAWRIGETVSRIDLVLFWSVGGVCLLVHRAAWAVFLPGAMREGGLRRRRVALMCLTGADTESVGTTLRRYGNAVATLAVRPDGLKDGDRVEDFIQAIRGQDVEEVFVAAGLSDAASLTEIGRRLRVLPQPVTLVPVGALRDLLKQNRVDFGSTVAVEMQRSPLSPFELALKRSVDVVGALCGLVVLSPLLLVVALAVRLDSPGPVLFRQTRHGFNGRPFLIYKFRTMRVLENGAVIRQATANDPRVTRVGRVLRRLSLDELPQLLNVISGDMSLVGPRPHASAHDKQFTEALEKYAFRHHVKAGLTGWAQIQGARGETDTIDKMKLRVDLDIWYINHWSLWLDFYIMLQTVRIVFKGENAH